MVLIGQISPFLLNHPLLSLIHFGGHVSWLVCLRSSFALYDQAAAVYLIPRRRAVIAW